MYSPGTCQPYLSNRSPTDGARLTESREKKCTRFSWMHLEIRAVCEESIFVQVTGFDTSPESGSVSGRSLCDRLDYGVSHSICVIETEMFPANGLVAMDLIAPSHRPTCQRAFYPLRIVWFCAFAHVKSDHMFGSQHWCHRPVRLVLLICDMVHHMFVSVYV